MIVYMYLYDHSSSDKEIDGRGPGRGEKANEEAFEDDGSKEHTIRLADWIRSEEGQISYKRFHSKHRLEDYIRRLSYKEGSFRRRVD